MKTITLIFIATLATFSCFGQGFSQDDLFVIKRYPPVKKSLVNPSQYNYKSKNGTLLTYLESEGKMRFTIVDSLSAIDKMDELEELAKTNIYADYTDGAQDAWVEGKLVVNNITYPLYGAYIAEGYLEGVVYDKNRNVFGILNWTIDDKMTATLKTKLQTFEYNFEKQIVDDIVVVSTEPETIMLTKPQPTGIATTASSFWKELLMSDLLQIISAPHTEKVKQLKKIGLTPDRILTDSVTQATDVSVSFARNRTADPKKLKILYQQKNQKTIYEITICDQHYVDRFIKDAQGSGFIIVNDKKSIYKLNSQQNIIVVTKSSFRHSEQMYTIRIE